MAGEGVGFGLGQMLQQGGMGGQMAQPMGAAAPAGGGIMASLASMLGGGQAGGGIDMSQLGPLMQMIQMQQAQQQNQQGPMQMGVGPMAGGLGGNMQGGTTQAQRGYLAQGGGIAPRNVVNRI